MKNWNNVDRDNWIVGTNTVAKAVLPINQMGDANGADAVLHQLRTDFVEYSSLSQKEITVESAIREFQLWLVQHHVKQHMAETEYLSVSIERNFGAEKVTFSIGAQFEITSGGARSASYDKLTDIVMQEFYRYARDRAPKYQGDGAGGQPRSSGNTITIPAESLVVDMKDGKKYYKVKAGQWQEHGVNYWPEDIKRGGVDPASIPLSGYPLTDYDVEILMDGDKPKKVIRLIRHGRGQ